METGREIKHRAIVADKGYDINTNREAARITGLSRSSLAIQTGATFPSILPKRSTGAAHASNK